MVCFYRDLYDHLYVNKTAHDHLRITVSLSQCVADCDDIAKKITIGFTSPQCLCHVVHRQGHIWLTDKNDSPYSCLESNVLLKVETYLENNIHLLYVSLCYNARKTKILIGLYLFNI